MDDSGGAWTLDDALDYGSDLLRGPRVTLRESREADFERLSRWWVDPAVAIFQSGNVRPTPATTVSDMMRGWGSNVGSDAGFTILRNAGDDGDEGEDGDDEAGDDGARSAVLADDTDRVIGQLSLFGVTKNRCATLGVIIGRDHWGDGLGTEAVGLMVRYGFVEMALHRIQLGVYAYNDRAIRSYKRVGFTEEGRRAEIAFHGDRWHDEVFMAILEQEWRRQLREDG